MHDRWVLNADKAASYPTVFLLLVLSWFAIEFFCFGLSSPRNALVTTAAALGALIVASAMFLVIDLEDPLTGPMRGSPRVLERAAAIIST